MAGGSLKLKGEAPKKKKKSSTTKRLREEAEGSNQTERDGSAEGGESNNVSRGESPIVNHGKTDAEIRFEAVQKTRLLEKAAKAAAKTHKERVAEFNEKLENLSEHYDIPKVGPG